MFGVITYRRWRVAHACLQIALCACGAMAIAPLAALSAGERDAVREIADNVRANEQLYRNIELVFRWKYDLREPDAEANRDALKHLDAGVRCVLQDGLLYFKIDGTAEGVDSKRASADTEQAFDGEYTRVYERRWIGNIHHGRFQDGRLPRPHTLIFRMGQMSRPLSAQLLASDYNERFAIRVAYMGEEDIDGLNCVKLRVDLWSKDEAPPPREQMDNWWIWLATDRNYLPIRHVGYAPSYSADLPIQTGTANDLREIAPGVWFPFRVDVTVFDELKLTKGEAVVSNVYEYPFSAAELDPSYPKSLFSDVRFPKGTAVYEVQDGKIIRSWVEGERGELISAGPVKRWWLVAFNISAGTLAAGWLIRRFWRARRDRALYTSRGPP